MGEFRLHSGVKISGECISGPVELGIRRFCRDMEMVLQTGQKSADGLQETILLKKAEKAPEEYSIEVCSQEELVIEAGDDLGFIYALHFISRKYLGVEPFWFWNDQKFEKKPEVRIPLSKYRSKKKPVKYRGWFINDEVLISRWTAGKDAGYPWEMAFEALLRCEGNVVIPGTDRNSKRYADLASSMGLWITHHHAEPLGAEMFLRAYPDKNPSFKENPELFRGLWEEGIQRQQNQKVIWNLGFRGQGDTPFWETDPMYDTPEKRGALISSIIEEQYELVKKYVTEPVCCTNLYGEIMELYQQGFLKLPENIIMIWADNGYGKMVSRRQGNHNPRVTALPGEGLQNQAHGVYYHVSFYDLQAANVLTMIPNSMEFVEKELNEAYRCGIRDLWLINCSNIKPHIYPLDFIASMWNGSGLNPEKHLETYLHLYYDEAVKKASGEMKETVLRKMKLCFQEYFRSMIPYGGREDEHAGEQFYNYVTRILIYGWMRDGGSRPCEELRWCAPMDSFAGQMEWYKTVCSNGYDRLAGFLKQCEDTAKAAGRLWEDSLLLQARIHVWCLNGVLHFTEAYGLYRKGMLMEAFCELGQAAEWYQLVDGEMKRCAHDKWEGYYDNDCQTDVKETAYQLGMLLGYVRNLGDGPYFYEWQRRVIYSERDRRVLLLTNEENHLTNEELYIAMKNKEDKVEELL